ncbi:MAG: RNA 2',3'-cyclic phosphodiesterase [Candidatus Cloacimonetes bacterium]|nr:RNA 2',3'-cyclic phosphodiesterase [Candidatus Cloacimonadota bacterium]
MRTFLALELPEEFKKEIAEVIQKLQDICPHGIKWVEKNKLHITLQFIGDTEPRAIKELSDSFATILAELKPFPIFKPLIEIIPPKNTRLVWIKCDFSSSQINDVVGKIRFYLKKRGFEIDKKPFRLHITLGRVKRFIPLTITESLTNIAINNKQWTVSEATFYESRLHSTGPEYKKIATYNLMEE